MNQVLSHLTEEERKIADQFEFSETVQALLSTINALRERLEAAERTIRDVQEILVTRNGISNVAVISAIIDTISGYIPPSPKAEEQSK